MTLHFRKYKFLTMLFYKRLESGSVDILEDKIKVFFSPFSFEYCGTYYIHSIIPDGVGNPMYRTIKGSGGEVPDFSMIDFGLGEYFISVSSNKKKVIIFDRKRDGVILKS
jgi:hypothetical protein